MRDLGVINVVDLEATCWDGDPPSGELQEIIEIGVARIDARDLSIIECHSIMVRPEHSQISKFCTELTSIKPEDVENGLSFKEACAWIKKELKPKDRLWASWGDFDRRMFERQCKETDVQYPWGVGHLNVKTLFALMCNLDKEVAMDQALNRLNIPLLGHHHRGVDDAHNIAQILLFMLRRSREALAVRK